jgi:hypothetical protein
MIPWSRDENGIVSWLLLIAFNTELHSRRPTFVCFCNCAPDLSTASMLRIWRWSWCVLICRHSKVVPLTGTSVLPGHGTPTKRKYSVDSELITLPGLQLYTRTALRVIQSCLMVECSSHGINSGRCRAAPSANVRCTLSPRANIR